MRNQGPNYNPRGQGERDYYEKRREPPRRTPAAEDDDDDDDDDDEEDFDWGECWRKNRIWIITVIVILLVVGAIVLTLYFLGYLPGFGTGKKKGSKKQRAKQSGEVEDYQTWVLEEHNRLRERHEARALILNEKMNRKAYDCAEYYLEIGKIDHSCPSKDIHGKDGEKYGENLYMAMKVKGDKKDLAKRAMDGWYREWEDYDFETGKSKNGKQIGHFTQLVWLEAFELGVGQLKKGDDAVVVCLYNPHGNIKDEYVEYVKPQKAR